MVREEKHPEQDAHLKKKKKNKTSESVKTLGSKK